MYWVIKLLFAQWFHFWTIQTIVECVIFFTQKVLYEDLITFWLIENVYINLNLQLIICTHLIIVSLVQNKLIDIQSVQNTLKSVRDFVFIQV